jgi:hypothetical protein
MTKSTSSECKDDTMAAVNIWTELEYLANLKTRARRVSRSSRSDVDICANERGYGQGHVTERSEGMEWGAKGMHSQACTLTSSAFAFAASASASSVACMM